MSTLINSLLSQSIPINTPEALAFLISLFITRIWWAGPEAVGLILRPAVTFTASKMRPFNTIYFAAGPRNCAGAYPDVGRIVTVSPGTAATVTGALQDVPPGMVLLSDSA